MTTLRTGNRRARRKAWTRARRWDKPLVAKGRRALQRHRIGQAVWAAILGRARSRAMGRIVQSTARMYGMEPVVEFRNDLSAPPTGYPR